MIVDRSLESEEVDLSFFARVDLTKIFASPGTLQSLNKTIKPLFSELVTRLIGFILRPNPKKGALEALFALPRLLLPNGIRGRLITYKVMQNVTMFYGGHFKELWEKPNIVLRYGSFEPTKKAIALAHAGELGAAIRALSSEGVLDPKDCYDKLLELHYVESSSPSETEMELSDQPMEDVAAGPAAAANTQKGEAAVPVNAANAQKGEIAASVAATNTQSPPPSPVNGTNANTATTVPSGTSDTVIAELQKDLRMEMESEANLSDTAIPASLLASSAEYSNAPCTIEDLRLAIKRAGWKRAADAMGWRMDIIKVLSAKAITAVCNLCLRIVTNPETLPEELRPYFFGARLIPLPKGKMVTRMLGR